MRGGSPARIACCRIRRPRKWKTWCGPPRSTPWRKSWETPRTCPTTGPVRRLYGANRGRSRQSNRNSTHNPSWNCGSTNSSAQSSTLATSKRGKPRATGEPSSTSAHPDRWPAGAWSKKNPSGSPGPISPSPAMTLTYATSPSTWTVRPSTCQRRTLGSMMTSTSVLGW